jgi:hypothetical protein
MRGLKKLNHTLFNMENIRNAYKILIRKPFEPIG